MTGPRPYRPPLESLREQAWSQRDPRAESDSPPPDRTTDNVGLGTVSAATVMALADELRETRTRLAHVDADLRALKATELRVEQLSAHDLEEQKARAVDAYKSKVAAERRVEEHAIELIRVKADSERRGRVQGAIVGAIATLFVSAILALAAYVRARV